MKILLLEDDEPTAAYIRVGLIGAGCIVEVAVDGRDGLGRAMQGAFDALIVDRMLPSIDGLSIVRALRASGSGIPVIFLTAMSGVDDRVEGLAAGGDDYLVKPFALSELMARLIALVRRPSTTGAPRTKLAVADLELDTISRTCKRRGTPIELLPREFALLEYLMGKEGKVVTRTMLLEHVWDFHFIPQTSIVETQISRIRAKVDKPFERQLIHTVHRIGYCVHP